MRKSFVAYFHTEWSVVTESRMRNLFVRFPHYARQFSVVSVSLYDIGRIAGDGDDLVAAARNFPNALERIPSIG